MAKATGQQTRGRKKDALRIFAEANVASAGAGPNKVRTVDLIAGSPKDATVALDENGGIPQHALFIPASYTLGKSDGTVRQTLRTVLNDAGITGEVHSYGVEREDADADPAKVNVWYVTGEAKPAPRTARKPATRKGAAKK